MKLKTFLAVLLILAGILVVSLFLMPQPPLEGTLPPEQLADPDRRFVEILAGYQKPLRAENRDRALW